MDWTAFAGTVSVVVIVSIVVEVIKRAANWTGETTARFAPLISVILGAVLNFLIYIVGPVETHNASNALLAVLIGFLQGASASGLYDLGGKNVIEAVAGEHKTP